MTNLTKNIFVVAVAIATIATFGLGFAMPSFAIETGDLVKGPNSDAVYYIDGTTKYVFPDAKTYFSWYSDFSNVQLVTVAELDNYSDGGMVLYRPGTKLITHPNTAKVYAVEPSGNLRWIPSEEIAAGLFGADWASRVNDVNEVFFPNYSVGSDLASATDVPNGSLVQMEGSDTIYYIDGMSKRPFASMDDLTSNGFDADYVLTVSDLSAYSDGTSISGAESSLMDVAQGGSIGSTTPPAELAGGLTVAKASDSPASSTTVASSDGIMFGKFNFTASDGAVTVTGMKVTRSGLGAYSDFDKVWLVVDGIRRGSVKSLNSADEANLLFSADTSKVVIADGSTKSFEIWASMSTGGSGNLNALGVAEVTTTSAVSGLPVTGNTMTHSTIEAPDVTLESATIGNAANVGDSDVVVAKFKVDNDESNETAIFKAITFKSITKSGTTRAYTDDFTNFRLYDNSGNMVAGPVEMGSDNYLRFTLSTPFEVEAGTSKYEWFYVKADVADGAGRTLNLSVEGMYDVAIYGGTNMYHADVADSYTDANEYVTLGASDLSVAVDTSVNPVAADVNQNSTIVLLRGNIRAEKGAVNADGLSITLTGTDMDFSADDAGTVATETDAQEFDNLRVYINDILVSEASAADISTSASQTSITKAFTDSFTVSGIVPFRVEIDVKDLQDSDTSTIIKATLTGSTITGSTEADGTSVTGTGSAAGNNMTVITPGYKIYKSATPITATKVLGAQNVEFLGFDIKSNNTTNVVVNKIKFQLNADDASGGAVFTAGQNDVQSLEIVDVNGNVVAGPVNLNSSKEYEFTGLALDINSNGSKYILRGDIASAMNDSDFVSGTDGLYFTIISSEGTANNNTYSGTNSAGTTIADGSTAAEINYDLATKMTIGTGTMTVTAASDTPVSAQLITGGTDQALAKWKLVAANENVQVKKFRVGLSTGTGGSDEIVKLALYEGATKLAETYSFAGGYTEFDITSNNFVVTAGTSNARYLTLKVDLNSITAGADSGATLAGVLIDLETWGATSEIDPKSGSTSDGFAFTDSAKNLNEAGFDSSETDLTIETGSGINAGDIIKLESEQMYVSSWDTGDTIAIVVRGYNGTVAAAHANATDVYVARSIEGNDFKVYGNKLSIGSAASVPSGSLAAWAGFTEVFKFKLIPNASATEDAVLNSVKVALKQSTGIGATVATDWWIGDMALYNGAGTLISQLVTADGTLDTPGTCGATGTDEQLCVGTDFVRFDAASVTAKNGAYSSGNRLNEAIAAGGEEYTVKIKTYGDVDTDDALQLYIASLGAVSTAGDLDWDDSNSANITWVDMGTTSSFDGGVFTK
ncbi:MAG: hypothetical protein ACKKL6_02255 [Candidatus Komeilibacteria bacterium]